MAGADPVVCGDRVDRGHGVARGDPQGQLRSHEWPQATGASMACGGCMACVDHMHATAAWHAAAWHAAAWLRRSVTPWPQVTGGRMVRCHGQVRPQGLRRPRGLRRSQAIGDVDDAPQRLCETAGRGCDAPLGNGDPVAQEPRQRGAPVPCPRGPPQGVSGGGQPEYQLRLGDTTLAAIARCRGPPRRMV